jgi:Ni/Fe-hydrogenase subunit HybB-like protein
MGSNSTFRISKNCLLTSVVLLLIGASTAIRGLSSAPDRIWPNLLLDTFYILSLGLSAMLFLTTQRLAGSRWSSALRRVSEAFMLLVPVASVLILPLWLGRRTLYAWGRPGAFAHENSIAGKVQYLQPHWILARSVLACLFWTASAWVIRRASIDQDRHPAQNLALHHRLNRYSALFIPIFAITFTTASFDWLISLEPEWFSTMFAIYVFAGVFVHGIAAITLATVLLRKSGYLSKAINEDRLHDLGKMLFAFSTFWGYIWVCQYLLIWYGNIPEEVTFYVKRANPQWLALFTLNFLMNWVAPFTLLLSAKAKQNARILKVTSIVVLLGRWLDLYVMIMPTQSVRPPLGLPEVLIATGYAALSYVVVLWCLVRAPLVPVNDPILAFELAPRRHFGQASGVVGFRE